MTNHANNVSETALTLLIPLYNSAKYLPDLAKNISSFTYASYKILLINDGSTDDTLRAANDYLPTATVITQKNTGIVGALNNGLKCADTDWVARADDDDRSAADRLEREMAAIDRGIVLICGSYQDVDEHGSVITTRYAPLTDTHMRLALYFNNPVAHGSAIIHRDSFNAIGGYRDIGPAEDYDAWIRLLECGKYRGIPEIIYYHVCSDRTISATRHEQQRMAAQRIRDAYWKEHVPTPLSISTIRHEITTIRHLCSNDSEAHYRQMLLGDLARLVSKYVHHKMFFSAFHQMMAMIVTSPCSSFRALTKQFMMTMKRS